MKNTFNKYFIVLLLTLTSSITFGQKQIHLCHGFTGSTDTWTDLNADLNSCPSVTTTVNTYTSNEGIDVYKAELINNFNSSGASADDLAIGHSFGGIVLRSMDKPGNNYFGGYFTIGTSHHGAKLANSVLDGKLENYLENGCDEIINDPFVAASEALASSPVSWILLPITGSLAIATDYLCNNLFDLGIILEEWVGNPFSGGSWKTAEDLRVGGPSSNFTSSTIPSIAITGVVSSPVHWNLLADKLEKDVPQTVQNLENKLNTYGDKLMDWSVDFQLSWKNPLSWVMPGLSEGMKNTAEEFYGGAQWLNTSESGWNEIIGSGGGGYWTQVEVEVDAPIDHQINPPGGDLCEMGLDNNTIIQLISVYVPYPSKPSDGVVPLASQQLEGALRTIDVQNVSHFAEPGDLNVRQAIANECNPIISVVEVFKIHNCSF